MKPKEPFRFDQGRVRRGTWAKARKGDLAPQPGCGCEGVCVCVWWWTGSGVAMGHGQGGSNPRKAVPAAPGSGLIPALLQPVIPGVLLSLVVEYF